MGIYTHILEGSGRLLPHRQRLLSFINKHLLTIQSCLPIDCVDLIIWDSPKQTIPHLGVGGYASDAHTLFISLDIDHQDFPRLLEIPLLRTLAHELHHVRRSQTVGYGETLLEALISEGLADHFEQELTGGEPQAWDLALSEEEIASFLQRAEAEFDSTRYDHNAWFYGNKEQHLPKWTGYSLGYFLVQNYLHRHPEKKPSRLFNVNAKDFLET